jgi:GNAT superfamily N-acetyltransferase
VIGVATVSPADEDARQLLAAYVEELNRRLTEGAHDVDTAWSEQHYGGSRGRVLVARLDGVPVGCAGLREHAPSAGEIKRFYVAPRARRRGVGRALLAWIEGAARELGYRRVVLDTAAPLIEAARLYETSGYARVAPFNDNLHAALWFEKVFPLNDDALWGAFRHATLPPTEWTHRSHIRVAFLHLARWSLDEAHLRMRVGIVRLNASHGLEETPDRGYHETLTRVWLALIAHAQVGNSHASSEALLAAHPELLDKQLAFRFYSRQCLLSLRARTIFVEPDIAPLPGV